MDDLQSVSLVDEVVGFSVSKSILHLKLAIVSFGKGSSRPLALFDMKLSFVLVDFGAQLPVVYEESGEGLGNIFVKSAPMLFQG